MSNYLNVKLRLGNKAGYNRRWGNEPHGTTRGSNVQGVGSGG